MREPSNEGAKEKNARKWLNLELLEDEAQKGNFVQGERNEGAQCEGQNHSAAPAFLPNGSDVIIAGCPKSGYLDAALILVMGRPGGVYLAGNGIPTSCQPVVPTAVPAPESDNQK